MSQDLHNFVTQYLPEIEDTLFKNLPVSHQPGTHRFNDALYYVIFPGGKRWRPLFTLLGGMIAGAAPQALYPAACAIEYLHSSSMIIDDLPAMDDADLRRGKPCLHVAYDESTALLVSLGLMNQSYSLLALTCQKSGHSRMAGRLITHAVDCIGGDGMIGGQVVDLKLRGNRLVNDVLVSRNLKTTALMGLMMTAGAIAANAYEEEIAVLSKFGEALGMAYQIYDDLLDESGEVEAIGKPLKQDARHRLPNFVSAYGSCGARKMAAQLISDANADIEAKFGNCREVRLLAAAAEMIAASHNLSLLSSKFALISAS